MPMKAQRIVLAGSAEQGPDGRWIGVCEATVQFDQVPPTPAVVRTIRSTEAFDDEREAVSAGLHAGMDWADQHYPS